MSDDAELSELNAMGVYTIGQILDHLFTSEWQPRGSDENTEY